MLMFGLKVSCVALSICLDLVATGSQDGTVNVHTVKVRHCAHTFARNLRILYCKYLP